jgi:hypothetical protein
MWSYHDYTTIAPGALKRRARSTRLEPARASACCARTRGILNRNYPIIAGWLGDHAGFSYAPPDAGAIVYARYRSRDQLHRAGHQAPLEKSLLIVPGDHFGMDGYLRSASVMNRSICARDWIGSARPSRTSACDLRIDDVRADSDRIRQRGAAVRVAAPGAARDAGARHGLHVRIVGIATRT